MSTHDQPEEAASRILRIKVARMTMNRQCFFAHLRIAGLAGWLAPSWASARDPWRLGLHCMQCSAPRATWPRALASLLMDGKLLMDEKLAHRALALYSHFISNPRDSAYACSAARLGPLGSDSCRFHPLPRRCWDFSHSPIPMVHMSLTLVSTSIWICFHMFECVSICVNMLENSWGCLDVNQCVQYV
jgi:hypothetical protein